MTSPTWTNHDWGAWTVDGPAKSDEYHHFGMVETGWNSENHGIHRFQVVQDFGTIHSIEHQWVYPKTNLYHSFEHDRPTGNHGLLENSQPIVGFLINPLIYRDLNCHVWVYCIPYTTRDIWCVYIYIIWIFLMDLVPEILGDTPGKCYLVMIFPKLEWPFGEYTPSTPKWMVAAPFEKEKGL